MEQTLQVFSNPEFGNIRAVEIDGEAWLAGKDVAGILQYERPTKAVVDHVDEEDRRMIDRETQSQIGIELGQRGGWLINESGLYSLVLSSKLPGAKKFGQWVTSELLPAIKNQKEENIVKNEVNEVQNSAGVDYALENRKDDTKMNGTLKIFENPEFGKIRVLERGDEPWFVAADVCRALEINNPRQALTRLDGDEKMTVTSNDGHSGQRGGAQSFNIVNEPGLYALVLTSRKPEAHQFKRWITHEVLPSIHKHGAYMTPQTLEAALLNPDVLIRLATTLKEEQNKRKELEAQAEADKPKVLFADAVSVSKSTILVRELAKFLKQNGIDIGQNRLFDWLRENGYLIRQRGTDYNMPTQRAMEMGLFEVKETAITHSDGHTTVIRTPYVTGRGQQYFINKFLAQSDNVGKEKTR